MTRGKKQSLDAILRNIEKSMGNDKEPVVVKAPTLESFDSVPVISFGYPEVDEASYCGGVPQGKLIEIFGPESSGKSFLSLKLISSAQKSGMQCCLVDAENSYDPVWADTHGVDTHALYIIRKSLSAEAILQYVDQLCKSGAFGLIIIDSTAALVPKAELEGSVEDRKVAELARVMSQGCRKIVANCADTNTTCVFVNQIREKVGVMFGNPQTTPGGRALKFYSHQRLKVTRIGKVTVMEGDKKVPIASKSKVQFVKNKSARPFGECEIEIVFDKTARNPVVKLCKEAKDYRIVSAREGTLRLHKTLFSDAKKNVDTGMKTMVELADYLVQSEMVDMVLEAYVDKYMEENEDESKIDPDILALRDDPSLIVSPLKAEELPLEAEESTKDKKSSEEK